MRCLSGRCAFKMTFLMIMAFLMPTILVEGQKNPPTYRIPLPPKPDFSSIEWMLGNWTGLMSKRSPQGEIHLSVSYELDGRVMVFREKISLAATAQVPAKKESSIGILSRAPSGESFQFQVYSSTGFISRYRVSVMDSEVDFTPDGGPQPLPGWLSRRIIQRNDVDGFTETVQLAPPLKPFFNYYTANFTRQPAPESSKPSHSKDHTQDNKSP